MCSHTVRDLTHENACPLISGFCTNGEKYPCFCSFLFTRIENYTGHFIASKGKQKDQRSSCRSIQATLNIKATRLHKGITDCARVTSAWCLTSHWAAVLCSADRGRYLSNTGRGERKLQLMVGSAQVLCSVWTLIDGIDSCAALRGTWLLFLIRSTSGNSISQSRVRQALAIVKAWLL